MSDGFGSEQPVSADAAWGWENGNPELEPRRPAADGGTGDDTADGYAVGRTGRGDYQGKPTGRGTVDAERTGRGRSWLRRDSSTEPAARSIRAIDTSSAGEVRQLGSLEKDPVAEDGTGSPEEFGFEIEKHTDRRTVAEKVRRDVVDVEAHTRGLN